MTGKLRANDKKFNIGLIRQSILQSIGEMSSSAKLDQVLKKELYKMAACADVFLDLHCDSGTGTYVTHSYIPYTWHSFYNNLI